VRHAYGPDRAQFGELHRPSRAVHHGTVVVIHGGFWRSAYDLSLGAPLAADLAARGFSAWNLEYRRVKAGGGWPATPDDVAAGIDLLATLDVDTDHVVTVGHSAGGHLAVWAAGRAVSPTGAPMVRVSAAVAQAGVLDLMTAARTGVGGTAIADLVGGSPEQVPERYAAADPMRALPIAAPVLCVHARADREVPFQQSVAYVAAATQAGGTATLREAAGDHFTLIQPDSPDWDIVVDSLPDLLSR
jgi:acetyl esterase/lipase